MSVSSARNLADAVYPAIEATRYANAEATGALIALDEDDPAAVCLANTAVDRGAEAYAALCRVRPNTITGFLALLSFHAEHVAAMEPDTLGVSALHHLLDVAAAILDPDP